MGYFRLCWHQTASILCSAWFQFVGVGNVGGGTVLKRSPPTTPQFLLLNGHSVFLSYVPVFQYCYSLIMNHYNIVHTTAYILKSLPCYAIPPSHPLHPKIWNENPVPCLVTITLYTWLSVVPVSPKIRLYALNLYWAPADMHKCTEARKTSTCTTANRSEQSMYHFDQGKNWFEQVTAV